MGGQGQGGEGVSDEWLVLCAGGACRAACYKQLSNFDGVISDCTSVLEVKVRIQSRLLLVVSATL